MSFKSFSRDSESNKLFSLNSKRSQSALEYMMTYGWAILVIVIVAVILYSMGIFNPSSSVTATSSGFSPFIVSSSLCNSSGLKVVLKAGPMPNGAESMTINKLYMNSASGVNTTAAIYSLTTPITLITGQSATILIPNVACSSPNKRYSLSAKLQYGYLTAAGNIVTNTTGTIAGLSTAGTSTQVTPPPQQQPAINYVALTINSATATPNPFQQMVTVNMNNYKEYAAANLSNIEFTYPNGTIIPSWRENGTTNTQTVVYWLKLGSFTTETVYMRFLPASTNALNNINTGEAPQLSATYGEYDDGVNVFPYYQRWGGLTALPSGWTLGAYTSTTFDPDYTVLTFSAPSPPDNIQSSTYMSAPFTSTPITYDFYGLLSIPSSINNAQSGYGVMSSTSSVANTPFMVLSWDFNAGGGTPIYFAVVNTNTGVLAPTSNSIYTSNILSDTELSGQINYGTAYTYSSSTAESLNYLNFDFSSGSGGTITDYIYWTRARAYPPNGVMPTVTLPSMNLYLNGVDDSNASILTSSQSNFTAVASSSSYYVAIYVNGTAVTPFTKGKATYLKTLSAGLYKVTAHSNSSGILNVTYYERVVSSTVSLSAFKEYQEINISNTQSTATPNPFQQIINFTSSDPGWTSISTSNFGQNVEFFYGNGTVIPSWLESYSGSNAIWWLKLGSIPASSSIIVYMGIASTSTNLFNTVNDGEAPQLSPTYAEYDDGAKVFDNYWNFNGTTLPSGWINTGMSVTVNNGITADASTSGTWGYTYYTTPYNPETQVIDTYAYFTGLVGATGPEQFIGWGRAGTTDIQYGLGDALSTSEYDFHLYSGSSSADVSISGGSLSAYQVWSTGSAGTSNAYLSLNYGTPVKQTTDYVATTSSYPDFSSYTTSYNIRIQWLRIRAYPPNGVMPTVTLPSINLYLNGVDDSNASILNSSQSNFTAVAPSSSYYVAIYVNGTAVTPFTKGKATYLKTLSAGLYKVTAHSNSSGILNVTYYERVISSTTFLSTFKGYQEINISNTQSTATPNPFQQMVNITSTDSGWSYINNTGNHFGQNVEFVYANGTVIPSWLESYSSSSAVWWVKVGSIPAGSSETVYAGFAPTTTNLFNNKTTGEAPQLSSVYGQYDNGQNIFVLYDNFSNLNSSTVKWVVAGGTPKPNYIVSDKLNLSSTATNTWEGLVLDSPINTQTESVDVYSYFSSLSSTGEEISVSNTKLNFGTSSVYHIGLTDNTVDYAIQDYNGASSIINTGVKQLSYGLWSILQNESNDTLLYFNYNNKTTDTTDIVPLTAGYINLESARSNIYILMQYINVRYTPPNGVMPSVSFGSVA